MKWISFTLKTGDIIVFTGIAEVVADAVSAGKISVYVEKYQEGFKRIRMTAVQFGQNFNVAIRVRSTNLRGH